METIPPYSSYHYFRDPTVQSFCPQTLIDLSILAYDNEENARKVLKASPFQFQEFLDYKSTQALIVRNNEGKIAVAFRGTSTFNLADWRTDFECAQADFNPLTFEQAKCKGVGETRIHQGFAEAYMVARYRILSIFAAAKRHPFIFTGHSLGGALATVAAWDCGNHSPGVSLVTFGSPRVGCGNFGREIMEHIEACFRFVHGDDLVPTLPLEHMGYEHICAPSLLSQMKRPWINIFVPRQVFDHVPTLYAQRLWENKNNPLDIHAS